MVLIVPLNYYAHSKVISESGTEANELANEKTYEIDQNANLVSSAKANRNRHGLRIQTASEFHHNSKSIESKTVSLFFIFILYILRSNSQIPTLNANKTIAVASVVVIEVVVEKQIRLTAGF